MADEKYSIGNKEFVLRDDLSIEEIELVVQFTAPFEADGKRAIISKRNYTLTEIIAIVKMLLTPLDGSDKEKFNWKQLTPEQTVIIIGDYLKKKAQENIIITASSKIYEEGMKQHLQHTIH